MNTISNMNELMANMKTLDGYLHARIDPEYKFALNLVKKGICFVAVKELGAYRFYPSRFIGYVANSMGAHLINREKDGRETNPVISKILGCKPLVNAALDQEYVRYCEALDFIAKDKGLYGVERKFWVIQK